jgi:tetratricopeptide (TPR) repeat protein
MNNLLPAVEAAVDGGVAAVNGGARSWRVAGPLGAGTSVVLEHLSERLDNRPTIHLAPPEREFDSAIWALMELSDSLTRLGYGNGDLSRVTAPDESWAAKVAAVDRALRQADGLVVLCDDPQAWLPGEAHFNHRAREIASIILNADGVQRIVAGRTPIPFGADETHTLPGSVTAAWLADDEEWGALTPTAVALSQAMPSLVASPPLVARALVGTAALTSVPQVAGFSGHTVTHRAAIRAFAGALAAREAGTPLRTVCAAVSSIRVAIEPETLLALGVSELTPIERDVVRHVLLFAENGAFRAPAAMRKEVAESVGHQTTLSASLVTHYENLAAGVLPNDPRSRTYALEAFHHAVQLGDADAALRQPVFFSEQLNILGRALSRAGDRAGAAAIFERAANQAPEDDYAHHYLAYNLDVDGLDAARVEREYELAIALRPDNPWWHSRHVTFLVTRGRLDEAWEAWNTALVHVRPEDYADSSFLYENLHFWVAYTLLNAGEYDLVRSVIAEVPAEVLSNNRGFDALVDRLEAMVEARDWGSFVPGYAFRPGWWRDPPELLPETKVGDALVTWFAGRVNHLDEESIEIDAAEIKNDELTANFTRPGRTAATFDRQHFDQVAVGGSAGGLRRGDYVQIGFYGSDDTDQDSVVVAVHPRNRWRSDGLPALTPHPQRYLRRALELAG